MTAHTPGPINYVNDHKGEPEHLPFSFYPVDDPLSEVARCAPGYARLIAAAPDLLAALEQCLSVLTHPVVGTYLHDDPDWYHALDLASNEARAALAKARGEGR